VFVHLGGEIVVDSREVVAILDARRMRRTAEARRLLARAVRGLPREAEARSVVVTTRGIHPIPVAAATVARRVAAPAKKPTAKRL
jgi:hypothetical protein